MRLNLEEQSGSASPLQSTEAIAGIGSYWDSIIFSIIVIFAAITAYFLIRFFINKQLTL